MILRDVKKLSWEAIAEEVYNLAGEHPTPRTCANYYRAFNSRIGRVRTKYANCGRRKWKITKEVEAYLLRRLKELRKTCMCVTSTTLQLDLAKHKKVKLSCSAIRKVLVKASGRKYVHVP